MLCGREEGFNKEYPLYTHIKTTEKYPIPAYVYNSAGTNVYFPHSKVLLLKRTNVRIVCFT